MSVLSVGLWRGAGAYGVMLWVISFLVVALLSALGISGRSLPAGIVLLLVAVFVTWTVGTRLSFVSISQGLGVGLLWVATNILLDVLVIVIGLQGGDTSFFRAWIVWGRYLVFFAIPLLLAARRESR